MGSASEPAVDGGEPRRVSTPAPCFETAGKEPRPRGGAAAPERSMQLGQQPVAADGVGHVRLDRYRSGGAGFLLPTGWCDDMGARERQRPDWRS